MYVETFHIWSLRAKTVISLPSSQTSASTSSAKQPQKTTDETYTILLKTFFILQDQLLHLYRQNKKREYIFLILYDLKIENKSKWESNI